MEWDGFGCVQYLYTVVFRRLPVMAHCREVCVCVCVCTVYKVGEEERRGLRDEVRREGDGEGEGLQ